MSQAVSIRRVVLLYLLVWLILSLVFAALIGASTGSVWQQALACSVPVTLVYAVACGFSAYYLCRAFPLAEKSPLVVLSVFLVAAMIAGALWTAMCAMWNDLLGALWQSPGLPLSNALLGMVFGVGVLLYGLSAVASYLAIEFGRARGAERRELEAALMARESELRLLRAQIDPHFLFNSLNSISALTSIDPARARTMTVSLADFFRHSLGLQASDRVPLHAEVALAMRFLAVETVRFGTRLQVTTEIDPAAGACLVPPMLLQPLVENAVKHGIAQMTAGGLVHVSARRAGSQVFINVRNDMDSDDENEHGWRAQYGGAGVPGITNGRGIGLANVRQRLATDFAHEASVHCIRRNGQFEVELMLPALSHPGEPPCAS